MSPHPEPSTQEVLAGLIERVTYHNAENGFCVLRARARGHRDVVTVVGHAASVSAGEWITASGDWVNDRTHGSQFKARFLRTSPPTSADGIEKYLSSGMIRGVGPVYAKQLVRAFGERSSISSSPRRTGCAKLMASGRSAPPAFSPPGPNRRRCGRSWSFCTATASVRHGQRGSSRPTVPTPSRSCRKTLTGSPAISVALASRLPCRTYVCLKLFGQCCRHWTSECAYQAAQCNLGDQQTGKGRIGIHPRKQWVDQNKIQYQGSKCSTGAFERCSH
jgi:ATP-dependent exoDNAse (exonuclease V) alpha subunit